MARVLSSSVNVVGDSLDACMYSRYLAENSSSVEEIVHYVTNEVGGVHFDAVKDSAYYMQFLKRQVKDKIQEYLPAYEFELVLDTFVKIPNKKIKFHTSYDGYVRFPITRSTFELDIDYADAVLNSMKLNEFLVEYKSTKNITKVMKSIFSDDFYMSVIKKIGSNQWNLNQSQIDPLRLYASVLSLDSLDDDSIVEYYHPNRGTSELCMKLLNHPKIKIVTASRRDIKSTIKSQVTRVSYICEYFDYYFDFMFGGLDYVQYCTEVHSRSLNDSELVRIYTPYDKTYHVFFEIDSVTYKVASKPSLITSNNFNRMALSPSISNYKKILDYKKVSAVSRNLKIVH